MIIRAFKSVDLAALHAINIAGEPGVGSVTSDRLASLIAAGACRVATDTGDTPIGFLLTHPPGAAYDSQNYQWFDERYESFVYIDRIAIAPNRRGQSIGAALYADLFERSAGQALFAGCEVNTAPPNPRSMHFHQRLGFETVGSQTHSPDYAVTYLARRIAP
ncbi:MAG: GNAT family N-acetyltransferase [Pseudomonadota bacterium]